MNKLRHNVVYVFSIFCDDVITPNLGNYRTDMTISSIKTFELFSVNNNFSYLVIPSYLVIVSYLVILSYLVIPSYLVT